jgi:hypothetical protein
LRRKSHLENRGLVTVGDSQSKNRRWAGRGGDFGTALHLDIVNVTDEVIMRYIEEQSKMERAKDENFKVNDE